MNGNKPAQAFDAIAAFYDADFSETPTGRFQRERVYAALQSLHLKPGCLLEINCGTGIDAVWWALKEWEVIATDISVGMVAQTQKEIEEFQVDNVRVFPADAACLPGALRENGLAGQRFDLLFSNFGGLNCLSPGDLRQFAQNCPELLQENGRLALVIMGRFCWWETLYFFFKGKWKTAFRRLSCKPVAARLDENTTVDTWYYSPSDVKRLFGEMHVELLEPIGIALPPSYLDAFFMKRPKWMNWLNRLEQKWRHRWLAYAADHYLIVLKNSR